MKSRRTTTKTKGRKQNNTEHRKTNKQTTKKAKQLILLWRFTKGYRTITKFTTHLKQTNLQNATADEQL